MLARRSVPALLAAATLVAGLAPAPSYATGPAATTPTASYPAVTTAGHPGAPPKAARNNAPPHPVSKLSLAGNDAHSTRLSWVNPTDPDFAGVLIRRAAGGTPPIAASDGTLVAVLDSRQTTFTNKHLAPASTYSYAVFSRSRSHAVGIAATLTTATRSASTTTGPRGELTDPQGRRPAGQMTSGLLEDPPVGGAISGRVTDSAGTGLAGVLVSAFDPSTPEYGPYVALTEQDGTYTVASLAAGSYQVCFYAQDTSGASATGYLDECHADQPPHTSSATPVAVSIGQTSTGVDAALAVAGAITGLVTDSSSAPVPSADIKVWVHGASQFAGAGHSDSSGAYTAKGLPTGSYTVCFDGSPAVSAAAPYGHTSSCTGDGLPVDVVAGQATTSDETVGLAGAVGGAVTGDNGPVAGVWVSVHDSAGSQLSSTHTDANGDYQVNGLAPGQVTVCYEPTYTAGGYQRTCYGAQPGSGVDSTPIAVTAGQLSTADVQLQQGASITGTITDASGTPISDVLVSAYGTSSYLGYYSQTDATGSYTFTGVSADDYQICFDPAYAPGPAPGGYAPECADDQLSVETADLVTVGASGSVTVNAVLSPGAVITGQVSDSAGNGIPNAFVDAYSVSGGYLSSSGVTDATGQYQLTGVPATAVVVCFQTDPDGGANGTGYLSECYDDEPDLSTANPVTTTTGQLSAGVDAVLADAPA